MTRVSGIKLMPGGDAFNQSINLVVLGYQAHLLSRFGTDGLATFLLSEAERRGVDVSHVSRDPSHPTSASVVLIGPTGDRNFIGSAGSTNSCLAASDFDTSIFASCRVVSIGSLYGSASLGGSVVAQVLAAAKAAGCVTVCDMMHSDCASLEDATHALRLVDFFIPNEVESMRFTGLSDVPAIAHALRAAGVGCAIIKLGERGCYISSTETEEYIEGFPTRPVDTTGAGDAFVAGFISGIVDGCGVVEAARRGCAAGRLTVEVVGATGGVQSKEQVLSMCQA
jgi:sugar/nucleoside kinase (ribokinase family)